MFRVKKWGLQWYHAPTSLNNDWLNDRVIFGVPWLGFARGKLWLRLFVVG